MTSWPSEERRRYVRVSKHFIVSFHEASDPLKKHNVSQIKNISLGGMCFVTSRPYEPTTKINLELKTPYLDNMLHLEGTVLESVERLPNMIYETHLSFEKLSSEAEFILSRTIEYFKDKSKQ